MPNLAALEQAANRRNEERRAIDRQKIADQNDRANLARLERIKEIFDHPAWELLRDIFLAQHASEQQVLLDPANPLTDMELRVLQAQLQTSDRIIRLDEYIAERVESLRTKISAAAKGTDESPISHT